MKKIFAVASALGWVCIAYDIFRIYQTHGNLDVFTLGFCLLAIVLTIAGILLRAWEK